MNEDEADQSRVRRPMAMTGPASLHPGRDQRWAERSVNIRLNQELRSTPSRGPSLEDDVERVDPSDDGTSVDGSLQQGMRHGAAAGFQVGHNGRGASNRPRYPPANGSQPRGAQREAHGVRIEQRDRGEQPEAVGIEIEQNDEGRPRTKIQRALVETELMPEHRSYHGAISGEMAKTKLQRCVPHGYLTRYSESNRKYTLSVYQKSPYQMKHFEIVFGRRFGQQYYKIANKTREFNDLQKLLDHYGENRIDPGLRTIGRCVTDDDFNRNVVDDGWCTLL